MRSPRSGTHGNGGPQPPIRKYEDDAGYSAHESDRRTPYSEYEKNRATNVKRTIFSEYTRDGDYTEEDRSSYSESDNGKRTPYSEYITEYTDETDDDRMSGTLGIARNQYCTTLNALVEGSDSSSSESSYSQSTFASQFDRMCNANVNTNCMATLFNRNTDVPGTIHFGGEHAATHQKVSLPLPLHYMDHLLPSKQEFNSALDNFAQKFDAGDEERERPGFPQVYKSLFEANLSQTASEEDEERLVDYAPRRKATERNRLQEPDFTKSKRGVLLSKVEKEKDPDILSPPTHIIIKDDFTAVSSAESFGFAPETQKTSIGAKHKKHRREGNDQLSSPRHPVSHQPSPRDMTPLCRSPRHASPGRPSPRHSSPRRTADKIKHKYNNNTNPDAPVTTPHGLDRLMRKQATSPSKRREEEEMPLFKGEVCMKSPISGRVPSNGKSNSFLFRHMDESRQDFSASEHRISNSGRDGTTFGIKVVSQVQSKPYQQPDRRVFNDPKEKESLRFDERLMPIKASADPAKASRAENQLMRNSNALPPCASENKTFMKKDEHIGVVAAIDANELLWRNSTRNVPHTLSLTLTRTGVSDLTGEPDVFGEAKIDPTPPEKAAASPLGNSGINVQVLSLKPTPTAVSELTGEAGDFEETRNHYIPLDNIVASLREIEIPLRKKQSAEEIQTKRSPIATSELRVQTSSGGNRRLTIDVAALQNAAIPKKPAQEESSLNEYIVTRRATSNKKAETLANLEDALMGSNASSSTEYNKFKRQVFNDTQVFAPDDSRSRPMEDPGNENKMTAEKRPESATIKCEETKIWLNDIKSKPTQLEFDDATSTRQSGPFETKGSLKSADESPREEKEFDKPSRRDKDKQDVRTDTMKGQGVNTVLLLYTSSFSDYCNDLSGDSGKSLEDPDGVHGDGTRKLEEEDCTLMSALDNEISLLESQITGLEQQDQVSEIYNDQITAASHHFEPAPRGSEDTLTSIIWATKMRDDDTRLESSANPSKPPVSRRKTGGNYRHFKPPLVPIEQGSISKAGKKPSNNSSSKVLSKQNKSTDATLVTAPTVMTMDTPFTMDGPLVLSPIVNGQEERRWNRNSIMLLKTSVALSIETGSSDAAEINAPFFFVFVVGTRKYFSDVLFFIVAWLRHLSSLCFDQREPGRFHVGLMVPPIAEDDVLCEHQLQNRSFVVSRLPSPNSEEPGIIVESFVPEMWAENESARRNRRALLPPLGGNSIWSRLFRKDRL